MDDLYGFSPVQAPRYQGYYIAVFIGTKHWFRLGWFETRDDALEAIEALRGMIDEVCETEGIIETQVTIAGACETWEDYENEWIKARPEVLAMIEETRRGMEEAVGHAESS